MSRDGVATREALFRAPLERVARQLTVLHGAVARLRPPAAGAEFAGRPEPADRSA